MNNVPLPASGASGEALSSVVAFEYCLSSSDDEQILVRTPGTAAAPPLPVQESRTPTPVTVATAAADNDDIVVVSGGSSDASDYPLAGAKMEDIVVTPEATNPLRPPPKKKTPAQVPCTKLHSIKGVAIEDINVLTLRKFVARVEFIPLAIRSLKKDEICTGIVLAKAKYDIDKANGNLEQAKAANAARATKGRVIVNKIRFANALFSDEIRLQLGDRARPLSAQELSQGLKTGQMFFSNLAECYNDDEKNNVWAHNSLKTGRNKSPPNMFSGTIEWEKAKSVYNEMTRDYEYSFNNWKKSGNHDDYDALLAQGKTDEEARAESDLKPFANFIRKNADWLLYFHEFVFQFPNVLEKLTGSLPKTAFTESIGGTSTKRTKNKKDKKGKGRDEGSSPTDNLVPAFGSMKRKNELLSVTLAEESLESSLDKMAKLKDDRRTAIRSAIDEGKLKRKSDIVSKLERGRKHIRRLAKFEKGKAKKQAKRAKAKKDRAAKKLSERIDSDESISSDDSSLLSSDDDPAPHWDESQETLVETVMDLDDRIEDKAKSIKRFKALRDEEHEKLRSEKKTPDTGSAE